jgi:hypothetical protein
MLVNAYTPSCTFKNFPRLDNELTAYYNHVYHTVPDRPILPVAGTKDWSTPRYVYESVLKITFRDMFYYIDLLFDNSPKTVIDVGCGECVWKKWFPNIIGFDARPNRFSQQDFVAQFDKNFSIDHANAYDCGMALNSLHFISWNSISDQINLAMNIVNDKFLFTFNLNMITDGPVCPTIEKIKMFKEILQSTTYNLIMFDSPLHRGITEENLSGFHRINGTVRFILQKI